jgi:hypothetical protein
MWSAVLFYPDPRRAAALAISTVHQTLCGTISSLARDILPFRSFLTQLNASLGIDPLRHHPLILVLTPSTYLRTIKRLRFESRFQ